MTKMNNRLQPVTVLGMTLYTGIETTAVVAAPPAAAAAAAATIVHLDDEKALIIIILFGTTVTISTTIPTTTPIWDYHQHLIIITRGHPPPLPLSLARASIITHHRLLYNLHLPKLTKVLVLLAKAFLNPHRVALLLFPAVGARG